MAIPSYSPQYQSTAINVGWLEVNGLSGGSINLGMGSVGGDGGGGGGGGGSSNQFVGITGDWGSSWINLGLIWSVSGAGAQAGAAPAGETQQRAQETAPAVIQPRAPTGPPGNPSPSGTFRFRWDSRSATARSGERAKEGRYARTPSRPPR